MVPSTTTQVLITLVLVVPGLVFLGVLVRLRGRTPADADLSSRLLRAIMASSAFALLYLILAGPQIETVADQTPLQALEHGRRYAALAMLAVFLIPTVTAVVFYLVGTSDKLERFKQTLVGENLRERLSRTDARPSAWDVAFDGIPPSFVRVQMKDGSWFGGYMGTSSYASSWPDPRNLYVEINYEMNEMGEFGEPVEGSAGAVIDCSEAVLVELIVPPEPQPDVAPSGTMKS